ncbi:MAG TPA: hypothetical protein VE011_10500 [Candidatus Dormibacteraeota bacterium]|nr:hypothetical protein [Candidatus Dormibacteraeota bacterium]
MELVLAGQVIATIACGGQTVLAPGSALPALPWALTVRATDGGVLSGQGDQPILFAAPLAEQGVLIRDRTVIVGPWPMSYGPAPATCATGVPAPGTPVPTSTQGPSQASSVELPNPGGTCAAGQFVAGTATSTYDFSTVMSRVADAFQPLTNAGAACALAVPKTIAMAGASGPYVAIGVGDTGRQVCVNSSCRTVYPPTYTVPAGGMVWILLRASWLLDEEGATGAPPRCANAIADVTRAEFPFAEGSIEIAWGIPFHVVCPNAASIGIVVGKTPAG